MKLTTILTATILAVTAYGTAIPSANADYELLKRDPEAGRPCRRPGMICNKKREAEPQPEPVAEPEAGRPCSRPGMICNKKREAEAEPEPIVEKREPEPEPEAQPKPGRPCRRPGMICN